MRFFHIPLLLLIALGALGMAKKATITVRFHVEANARDGQPFAMPVKFKNPPRDGAVAQIPAISERNIEALYPYPAPDGTFGCAFKLNSFGRTALEEMSLSNRGATVVAFVGTKGGTHQVAELVIDKVIHDGIITIPSGLTALEVEALRKEYKVAGQNQKKP